MKTKKNKKYICIGRTYSSHNAMIQRCYSISNNRYKSYGARGIKVCERWMNYKNFVDDMGMRPIGKTLDRIDSNKDYMPSNCRWSTYKEQNRNRTNNRILEFKNKKLTLAEWAEITGFTESIIRARIDQLGWTIDKALTEPKRGD